MLELWQTEWCPASRRVRERLTELGVDYVTRQVPVDKDQRTLLLQKTGTDTIPALVENDGAALIGEDEIRRYLDEHGVPRFEQGVIRVRGPKHARGHRKAAGDETGRIAGSVQPLVVHRR